MPVIVSRVAPGTPVSFLNLACKSYFQEYVLIFISLRRGEKNDFF